jgi:hypothetical protein
VELQECPSAVFPVTRRACDYVRRKVPVRIHTGTAGSLLVTLVVSIRVIVDCMIQVCL